MIRWPKRVTLRSRVRWVWLERSKVDLHGDLMMGRMSDKLYEIAARLAGDDPDLIDDIQSKIRDDPWSVARDYFNDLSTEDRALLGYHDEAEHPDMAEDLSEDASVRFVDSKMRRVMDDWPKAPPKARVWSGDIFSQMAGQRRALLIGCSDYAHLPPLASPPADIDAVADVLGDARIGCFQSVEKAKVGKDRTPDAIKSDVLNWIEVSESGDTLLIYFSGHAFSKGLGDGLYLATEATDPRKPDTAVDLESILDAFSRSRAPSLLLVLDCCQSGAASGQLSRALSPRSLRSDNGYDANFGYGGLRIITSATIGEFAYEGEDGALSPFTDLFVDGLRSGTADKDRDGIVSDVEIFSHIERSRFAGANENLQTPTHSVLDGRTPYLLALNRFAVEDVRIEDLHDDHVELYVALKSMVDLVVQCAPISFMIVCFRYDFVDVGGYARASGLTVSATHTPFVAVSPDGLLCDTFFHRHMVPEELAAQQPGRKMVRTRLLVPWNEILLISGIDLRTRKQWNIYVPPGNTVTPIIG